MAKRDCVSTWSRGRSSGCLGDMKKYCINGKLEIVVGVVMSCKRNELGDMTITLKDPTDIMGGTIHYKVFQNEDNGYAKSIKVRSIMILRNASVWTPKPSKHYLNNTIRNIVKIRSLFECDFVSLDSRLQSKKSAMDSSFTLGLTEEANNVKILQSCNGFLMCASSGRPVFYYTVRYRWSIVLREKEEDSFLVINLSGKVVQYNLISKTLHKIYDCGSNQLDDNHDDDDDDELLQQFEVEYEFISSFATARPKVQFVTGGGLFVETTRFVQVDPVLGVVGARYFDLDLGFSGLVIAAFLELDPGLPL
uniref:Homologous recombination OB-fold protein OB-fold domain-containing protein n=1 Tax=Tanacetum cinerariifolium TaxID=118510 RepID=A0A6L2N7X3_TANCI|nr:hypothetical protein [Tanacetum cinerariifolium]